MCKIIYKAQCNICQIDNDVTCKQGDTIMCHQCAFDSKNKKQMAMFFNTIKREPNLCRPCKNREKNNCAGYQGKGMIMYYDKGFDQDWRELCGACWKNFEKKIFHDR